MYLNFPFVFHFSFGFFLVLLWLHLPCSTNCSELQQELPEKSQLDVGKHDFKNDQKQCPTLSDVRLKVDEGKEIKVRNRVIKFEAIDGLIYRVCIQSPS